MATPVNEPANEPANEHAAESVNDAAPAADSGRSRLSMFLLGQIGRRGAALLFFALLDGVYGYSLVFPPADDRLGASLRFVTTVAPLRLWGMVWLVAGLVCLINAFLVRDRVGFAAAISVKIVWGLLYVFGAVVGVDRAYIGAVIWLSMAAWIAIIGSWPEPPVTPARSRTALKWGR